MLLKLILESKNINNPIISKISAEIILTYWMYEYRIDVKNAVMKIIIIKILNNPQINEISFILFLVEVPVYI